MFCWYKKDEYFSQLDLQNGFNQKSTQGIVMTFYNIYEHWLEFL